MIKTLWKTSAFRQAFSYAALFALCSAILCIAVMWSATNFMERQIDVAVHGELVEVQADAAAASGSDADLIAVINGMIAHSPEFLYLLQSRDHTVLAGNMKAIHPVPGVRRLAHSHRYAHQLKHDPVRGEGVLLKSGAYLFVGSSANNVAELRESLMRAFAWCVLPILILSLISGFALSVQIGSKIEKIASTAAAIMEGDLTQRITHRKSHDEYDHLADILNAMLDRICVLMTNLSQVTNDIAHDLRTPLSHLRQKLELAATGRSQTIDLDEMLVYVDRILETFSALLRIAQIESGSRRAGFASIDLRPILLTLVEAYQVVAEENGQSFSCILPPGRLYILGDHALVTQLFANLIENAIKHSGPHTTVSIDAETVDELISISVTDNGPGIPLEERERVFQRFYRVERSRTTPGNGLGLPTAAAIASLHGGVISIADAQPGAVFCVTFRSLGLSALDHEQGQSAC